MIGSATALENPRDQRREVAENLPALAQLEKPELLRDHGLILENVDGAEAPTTKFVMRSVPHCFSLSTSIAPAPIVNGDGTGVDGTTQPPIQRRRSARRSRRRPDWGPD